MTERALSIVDDDMEFEHISNELDVKSLEEKTSHKYSLGITRKQRGPMSSGGDRDSTEAIRITQKLYTENEYQEINILEDKKLFKKVLTSKRIKRKKLRGFIFPKREIVSQFEVKKHFTLSPKD